MFSTKTNIEFLCDKIFVDGTFEFCSKYFNIKNKNI
jgi:hypothetical protein